MIFCNHCLPTNFGNAAIWGARCYGSAILLMPTLGTPIPTSRLPTSLFIEKMKVNCPKCNKLLSIPDQLAGKVVKCPCGQTLKTKATQQAAGGNPKMSNPALTACVDCGANISKKAASCPQCGSPCSGSGSPSLNFNSIPTTPAPSYSPPHYQQPIHHQQVANPYASEFIRNAQTSAPRPQQAAPESNLSKQSIILSCVGFLCFGIFLAPIALVIAIVALSKGESNAGGALVLAIISFIFNVFFFMFALVL